MGKMSDVKIGVIGLGKLGLPLAVTLGSAKYNVVGFDKSHELIHNLQTGSFSSLEPGINECLKSKSQTISFSANMSDLKECTLLYIIVPTPSDKSGKFSSQHVEDVISEIARLFHDSLVDRYVVIVSTLMPGETRRISNEYLAKVRIKLLYSPEFIALGTVMHNLSNPDAVLVGCENSMDAQTHLQVQRKITGGAKESILNWEEAEIVKLLVNCYVTMKISFANFIGEISDVIEQANPVKVSEALGLDSRIGGLYLRPGLGFAGPCFPRDNFALLSWANEVGLQANLSAATILINDRQPLMAAKRILRIIEDDLSATLVGLVYKPNTEIMDHSQMFAIAEILRSHGVKVEVYDPYLSASDRERVGNLFPILESLEQSTSFKTVILPREFLPLLNSNEMHFENVVVL